MDTLVFKRTQGLVGGCEDKQGARFAALQKRLLQFSVFNFLLVACLGLLLRSVPFLPSFPLEYKNLLHGHSHFAFGGWVMPLLLLLMLTYFPALQKGIAYRHWRNISVLTLVSAYGMLASFPVQGYKAVSISFSTLSIVAGYYLAVVVWKYLDRQPASVPHRFLKAALVYLSLSALGPFATGPLIALGKAGTPFYFDAIYFYLHFQYNGWFVLTLLAVWYKILDALKVPHNGQKVFVLFAYACLPAYFLSVLWSGPSLVFHVIGGLAAAAQVVGVYFLAKDVKGLTWSQKTLAMLFKVAFAAFVVKNVLQLLGALPPIALLAYAYRNFVIAYLHLVLLGFVSLLGLVWLFRARQISWNKRAKSGMVLFLFSFITTEVLLVANAAGAQQAFTVPHFALWMLLLSIGFPVGIGLLLTSIIYRRQLMFPKTLA